MDFGSLQVSLYVELLWLSLLSTILQAMLKKFPKLSAYVERIEALPSVKAAVKKLEASYS